MKECTVIYKDGTSEIIKDYISVTPIEIGREAILRFIKRFEQVTSINDNPLPCDFEDIVVSHVKKFAFSHPE